MGFQRRLVTSLVVSLLLSPVNGWSKGFCTIRRRHELGASTIPLMTKPLLSLSPGTRSVHRLPTCSMLLAEDYDATPSVPLLLAVAVVLGIAAQSWINRLASGEQGLGAFLKDGRGYQKSGFIFDQSDRAVKSDPLPWLKLPKLDFVEVAGQEEDSAAVIGRLERLREELNTKIDQGDLKGAKLKQIELQSLMESFSVTFEPADDAETDQFQ